MLPGLMPSPRQLCAIAGMPADEIRTVERQGSMEFVDFMLVTLITALPQSYADHVGLF